MGYLIKVFVCDKSNGKGLSGQRVKAYGSSEVKTDSSGYASLLVDGSTTVYVNGFQVYSGYASSAPSPIVYEK